MKKLLLMATAIVLFALPAEAATMRTLGGQAFDIDQGTNLVIGQGVPAGNQPLNAPCVICGANQPNQTNLDQNFGYTDYGNKGNLTTEAFFSSGIIRDGNLNEDTISLVNYSGAQLKALIIALGGQNAFSIGIDLNEAPGKGPQTLESFFFLDVTPGSFQVLASYLPALGDSIDLNAVNNGTGFPDYSLDGLTTLGLINNHQYAFYARMTNINDGPDSFFIQPAIAAVPIPAVGSGLPMLIAGIGGLVALQRRRKARNSQIVAA